MTTKRRPSRWETGAWLRMTELVRDAALDGISIGQYAALYLHVKRATLVGYLTGARRIPRRVVRYYCPESD